MAKFKRMLAMFLVMVMLVSALPMQVLAADETVIENETVVDGNVKTEIKTETTTSADADGNKVITVEIQSTTAGTDSTGANVSGSASETSMTVTDSNGNVVDSTSTSQSSTTTTSTSTDMTTGTTTEVVVEEVIKGESENGVTSDYQETTTTTTTTETNGVSTSTTVVEGSESTVGLPGESPENVTVTIPGLDDSSTEAKENEVFFGDPVGTESTTDNLEDGNDDKNYDSTTTTVIQQGSVTVTTNDVTVTDVIDPEGTKLEHVTSDVTPNDSNDLTYAGQAPEEYLPGYEGDPVPPTLVPGYDYVYVGSGNTSKLFPAIVFESPLTDEQKVEQYGEGAYIKKNSITYYYVGWLKEEDRNNLAKNPDGSYVTDENGFILDKEGNRVLKEERVATRPDGTPAYLHRFDNYGDSLKVEGWYENGEWVKPMNGSDGYFAIWSGPQQFILVDGEGNAVTTYCADFATPTQDAFGYNIANLENATYYSEAEAEKIRSIAKNGYWGVESGEGSLTYMKEQLLATGKFNEEELNSLTDGVALTATQMAIWSQSNKMSGLEFINAHYSNWGPGDVPKDKEDEVKLLFKLYDHLIALAPAKTENTTADTIINSSTFIEEMSVTVVEKIEDHGNNADDDSTNDAYKTNLTFSLVVAPSGNGEDDLVAYLFDANGNEVARGRIAGELQPGERDLRNTNGKEYCFEGVTMIEGDQNFKINLSGIQHLEQGVYLYSSEVTNGTSSQTMVGIANGNRSVDVTMDINFELKVDEGVVATERVWHYEKDPVVTPPEPVEGPEEEPEENEDTPANWIPPQNNRLANDTVEIADEPVPLAAPVKTGDNTVTWIAFALMIACCMIAINVYDKKRSSEIN